MRIAVLVGLVIPAYYDWRSRWIDDRSWSMFLPAYLILIYGLWIRVFSYMMILEGVLLSLLIIVSMYMFRRFGYVLGGADFVLLAIIAPLSFVYDVSYNFGPLIFPGFLIFLLTTSILSIFYVVSICIWRNRRRFGEVGGIGDFLRLFYSYETSSFNEDKEILLYDAGEKKRVTPGVPMVTFAFLASLLIFIVEYIL